jgi:dTDP-4-amino-4,6-dideoxygalactose transaminase
VRADLNLDLDRIEALLAGDVLAVVGVHMYALPLDIARVAALAAAAGAYTIDDAAHVVAAPHGLQGDTGILSFNQSKTLTGGSPDGGGALFVTNEALRPGLVRRHAALAEGKSRLRAYVWFALRFGVEITPRALPEYIGDLDIPIKWATGAETARAEKMSAAAALAVSAQTDRLDQINTGRTNVVGHYLDILRAHERLAFVQTAEARYLSRMMVRWTGGPTAADVREQLLRRGFATRMPYPMWTTGDDPTAAFIREVNATHLELPGAPHLSRAEIEELVTALSLCLKSA